MSQFFIGVTAGALPPVVPTTFQEQIGNAIPDTNVLIVDAFDSTENNNNGIITRGGAAAGDPPGTGVGNEVSIYITNRTQDIVTTADATLTTITTFTPVATGNYAFDFYVSAFNTTGNLGAAYRVFVGFSFVGGVATKLNLEDKIVNEQAGMAGCNVTAASGGATFLLQVTGIAATTINWNAVGTYVFVGA